VFPQDVSTQNDSSTPSPPQPRPLPSAIRSLSPTREGDNEKSNPRVLLVDDNAINLKLLVVFAKRQNLRYVEATNGLEALETYKKEAASSSPPTRPFDFILMDVSMPVMDGLTSTRQIRAYEKKTGLSRSNIIALTGLASAQDQQDAQDAGVDTYLVKPVKFADVKKIFEGK
jgi:CheY-like chemotaxis protein